MVCHHPWSPSPQFSAPPLSVGSIPPQPGTLHLGCCIPPDGTHPSPGLSCLHARRERPRGPGVGGCRPHPPALLKPQPRKKPRSSGASPIRGLWSGVKDSERKGGLSSLQVRTPGAAPPERAATEAGSARASFSRPAPSSRPSSGPPPPGNLPGCFCHLPPSSLAFPARTTQPESGSALRGPGVPHGHHHSPSPHCSVWPPHPQHHLLAVTLPVTLAHWTVSARWAGTGLGSARGPAQAGAR